MLVSSYYTGQTNKKCTLLFWSVLIKVCKCFSVWEEELKEKKKQVETLKKQLQEVGE